MIERTTSGEHLIAYGIFGSYALTRSKNDPNLGIVMPNDYTLIASRVAFLSNKAKNPNAGKLFLDYLLSKRGQTIIANQAELYSLRDDVQGEATVAQVKAQVGDKIRPIKIDEAFYLAYYSEFKFCFSTVRRVSATAIASAAASVIVAARVRNPSKSLSTISNQTLVLSANGLNGLSVMATRGVFWLTTWRVYSTVVGA